MEVNAKDCLLCGKCNNAGSFVSVKQKGLGTLIAASKERGDNQWEVLVQWLTNNEEVTVHTKCRKNYTRQNSIEASKKTAKSSSSTSQLSLVKKN